MDLTPKHLRITNYNKLAEKFITVQVKSSLEKNKSETLYAIIEILCPWNPNAQIGQSIINTLSREYYKQHNSNELINFENALKSVNERLVQITQNGDTDWIGKINAALILIKKDKIHISYTGKIRGYLLRSAKLLPIINYKENYTYHHPLKTFSNVISGQLKLNDKIFFSTNHLFDHIDSKKLEKLLSEEEIMHNAMQIANILKTRNLSTSNALLIQMNTLTDKQDRYNDVIYLDEQKFAYFMQSVKQFFNQSKDNLLNVFKSISNGLGKSKKYYKEKIAPSTQKAWQKTQDFTKSNKQLKNFSQKAKEFSKNITDKSSSLKPKKDINVNHYSNSTQKITIFFKKLFDQIKILLRKLWAFLKNAFSSKNRSKAYIAIAAILFVIFIANIGYLQKINKDKELNTQIEQEIKDLEIKKDDASLAILTDDKERANTLLNEILEDIKKYDSNPNFKDKINSLKDEVYVLLDKISNIERLTDSQEIIKFDGCSNFYIIEKQIYCVEPDNNQILKTTENSDNPANQVSTIPNSSGKFNHGSTKENDLIIVTDKNIVYKLSSDELSEINIESGSWPNSIAIASFVNNLYFLDSSVGQIYKITPSGDKYSSPSDYLESETDITNSVDLAIDGSIYVLKNDGNIIKLSLGSQENFEIRNIPAPNSSISNPKKIYTSEELDSLFILDDNRILELSKDGDFKNQYNFDQDKKNITDFSINTKSKEIFILNDNVLFKYNY